MANNLTNEALLGYTNAGAKCPYLATSDSSDAWHIGQWLNLTGRSLPRDVRRSRGYTFHVNDMKVRMHYRKSGTQIERIA
jgi:hypothetical protein